MTTTAPRPRTVQLSAAALDVSLIDVLPGAPDPVHQPETRQRPTRSGSAGAFGTRRARVRYWTLMAVMCVLAVGFGTGLIAWGNPMPFGSEGFWLIAKRRVNSVFVMLIVAVCQALATVAFQTVTNNRIITPSIMGFESLYRAIQTTTVYLFGLGGLIAFTGLDAFLIQVGLMTGLALALYGWLLSGKYANLQIMLLVGIIIGGGLGSVSSFMQRLLTPSEFDVLAARTFGSVNNADPSYFPVAVPLVIVAAAVLLLRSHKLNTVALGRETCVNLGVNHRRNLIVVLIACAVLIAVSTALVGPMTFLGFLVATLAYQLADTYDHRYVFPMAMVTGFVVLSGAYFVMNHVFYAAGVVSIIIELVGGGLFLIVILKKGRL